MFLRLIPTNREIEADQTSLETDSYISTGNVILETAHTLSDSCRDSVRLPMADKIELLGIAEETYVYYRIYAEDGAIPSKAPADPGNPFVGRIKTRTVPPPHTANSVKRCIAKMEDIRDRTSTSLFLSPCSQSPMGDTDKVPIVNRTGPGSTPQEPLALVARISDYERSALESGGRGGLVSVAKSDTTLRLPDIRYLYYHLYVDDSDMPSKMAIDPEEPFLGRIRANFVAPPRSPASIKQCISRVERMRLTHADLFPDTSCDSPLIEGDILNSLTDGPGQSPNKPMAIVVRVESPIPDGRYVIKNRADDIYWAVRQFFWTTWKVYSWTTTMTQVQAQDYRDVQLDIIHDDTNGNIYMKSPSSRFWWVGAELKVSAVPVPWRLIPADNNFYYLTTDVNPVSQNPRVSVSTKHNTPMSMATLNEGDQSQMWEFICI